PAAWDPDPAHTPCSALTGTGIDVLVERLGEWVREHVGDRSGEDIVTSVRALDHFGAAHELMRRGAENVGVLPTEVLLVDLRGALGELEKLLGIDASDAVLDRVFARFCVGK